MELSVRGSEDNDCKFDVVGSSVPCYRRKTFVERLSELFEEYCVNVITTDDDEVVMCYLQDGEGQYVNLSENDQLRHHFNQDI